MYLIVLLTVIVYFMIEYINRNWLHWIKLERITFIERRIRKTLKLPLTLTFALDVRQQENRIRQHLIAKLDNGMKWYIVVVSTIQENGYN